MGITGLPEHCADPAHGTQARGSPGPNRSRSAARRGLTGRSRPPYISSIAAGRARMSPLLPPVSDQVEHRDIAEAVDRLIS